MSATLPASSPTTPHRPAGGRYSIYDPVLFGIDEDGLPGRAVTLIYRNLLIGGEPGSGKSSLLNTIIAHVALCPDARLWLFDGKLVELGPWAPVADVFVGNDITYANDRLRALQAEMDTRYARLRAAGAARSCPPTGSTSSPCVIDELAFFSVTIGTKEQQEEFKALVRDLVARGRAAGIIMIAATQRPSADIIPTSLRDLFGYRVAFRCTTDSSRRTSSCPSAGPRRATPPRPSRPMTTTAASASCSPKAASPAGSRPPTSTTTRSPRSSPTPCASATARPDNRPGNRHHKRIHPTPE